MNNTIWITDPHLNYLSEKQLANFITELKSLQPSDLLISGDISNSNALVACLQRLSLELNNTKIYFVLGNHCYWGSSFKAINEKIKFLCEQNENLIWLTDSGVHKLSNGQSIVGSGGWYSMESPPVFPFVYFGDWLRIKELRAIFGFEKFINFVRNMTQEKMDVLEIKLDEALQTSESVVVLTHFPPGFIESGSRMIDTFWRPYDVNSILRDLLLRYSGKYSNRQITVLCGHTHYPGFVSLADNVGVRIGEPSLGSFKGEILK